MKKISTLTPYIAICTVGELFGGVERHVLGIQKGLEAEGIRTLLVLFHDGELAKQARDQGIELIVLPSPASLSTSISISRQPAGAFVCALPSFMSSASRASFIAFNAASRAHSHLTWRRRIERSLAMRSALCANT